MGRYDFHRAAPFVRIHIFKTHTKITNYDNLAYGVFYWRFYWLLSFVWRFIAVPLFIIYVFGQWK